MKRYLLFFFFTGVTSYLFGVNDIEKAKKEISIQEKPGSSVLLDVTFRDENDKAVKIRDYFRKNQKPVILTPVYYTCPHLCTYIFNGLSDAVNKETKYTLGKDYKILSVSMHEKEKSEQARFKKDALFEEIQSFQDETDQKRKKEIKSNWSFLTGEKNKIKAFYDSVGFRYKEDKKEYAHTASIIFLTPEGKVARYLYGILYPKNDFRLAILEASQGKISSFVDQVFFYCFRYNSAKRVYNLVAWRVMTIGALLTITLVAVLLLFFWMKEKKKKFSET